MSTDSFKSACESGDLTLVNKLSDDHGLYIVDEFCLEGLCSASAGGQHSVVSAIIERYKVTASDAAKFISRAVGMACQNGHLAVAQLLIERFGFPAGDHRRQLAYCAIFPL
jgi:hypothetical protein